MIRALADKREHIVPKGEWTVRYVFFSRQGFTESAREEAAALSADLVTLERLEGDMPSG